MNMLLGLFLGVIISTFLQPTQQVGGNPDKVSATVCDSREIISQTINMLFKELNGDESPKAAYPLQVVEHLDEDGVLKFCEMTLKVEFLDGTTKKSLSPIKYELDLDENPVEVKIIEGDDIDNFK